jgi:hypothetical protein
MKTKHSMRLVASLCSCDAIRGWRDGAPPRRHRAICRRKALLGLIGAAPPSHLLPIAPNFARASPMVPLETSSGIVRVEEIGGGLDLLSPRSLTYSDAFYPSSMIDTDWKVLRAVTSVEGDLGQAALVWRLLGGSDERAFNSKLTEVYEAHFIAPPETAKDAFYEYDGKLLKAAILDRGSELSSRTGLAKDSPHWDAEGNSLDYTRNNDAVNLTVVRRKIEPPSDSGFGSDEVYRILSSAGGVFTGTSLYRAARVRRRYRRGYDEVTGKRTLDCIEIVTTHRVLDGIAGLEFPTSTCKTRMRYTQS